MRWGAAVGAIVALVGFTASTAVADSAFAATGSILAEVVPASSTGNGRGVAFDGTSLFYTTELDPHIYKVNTAGAVVATLSLPTDVPFFGGPLAWDGDALWTINYAQDFFLRRVHPVDGSIISSCNIAAANPGHPALFPNQLHGIGEHPVGLDWSGRSLWITSDPFLENWVAELDPNCKILTAFQTASMYPHGVSGVAFVGGT